MSYPFGVAGPILFLYFAFMILKPKIEARTVAGLEMLEIALRNQEHFGRTLGEVMSGLPADVQIVALRRAHHNQPASPGHVVAENDVVLVVGSSQGGARAGAKASAKRRPAASSRTAATWTTCACSHRAPRVVGRTIGDLKLPGDRAVVMAQVRRGDANILPRPTSCSNSATASACWPIATTSRRCASSSATRSRARRSSAISPSAWAWRSASCSAPSSSRCRASASSSVGLSGVLIVALILGKQRRTGGMNWTIPLSANLVLRNLGLTLFLAQVGMASGPKFAATVTRDRAA